MLVGKGSKNIVNSLCRYSSNVPKLERSVPFNCGSSPLTHYTCSQCAYKTHLVVFLNEHIVNSHFSFLKQHSLDSEPELKHYKCEWCSFKSYSPLHWLKHVKTKHTRAKKVTFALDRKTKWKIDKNMYKTRKKYSLRSQKSQETVDGFKCPYETRKRHLGVEKQQTKWLKCSKCTFKTKIHSELEQHVPKHVIKLYHCKQCDFRAKNSELLTRHVQVEHQCDFESKLNFHLVCNKQKKHVAQPESEPKKIKKPTWLQCHFCTFKTNEKTYLTEHISLKHKNEDLWFSCPQCPFKTTMENSFKRHLKTKHSVCQNDVFEIFEKWLECGQCAFKTKDRAQLSQHVTVEHKPKKKKVELLKCSQCEFKCEEQNKLKQHVEVEHKSGGVQFVATVPTVPAVPAVTTVPAYQPYQPYYYLII